MAMWAGRFSKEVDGGVNAFNSSIAVDSRMYKQDILCSKAHAGMLAACGIVSPESRDRIIDGLSDILRDIDSGTLEFDPAAEDVHMFIEAELTARIGDDGKRLHTARSRNDQVATDFRRYTADECGNIVTLLKALVTCLCDIAEEHHDTVMSGYTHLQRAQPVTLGHHLMAYAFMFLRHIDRIGDALRRVLICPLGSGALAGTTYPIDREATARDCGFNKPCENSLDGVGSRDFAIEVCSVLSLIMADLSRFSEEIILWCSFEFKFIELDDAYATGSSIMPQKKNPDIAELVRGKAARVFAHNGALLTLMKGLPLAYNKDLQEDKELLFDSIDTVKLCLPVFTDMLRTMTVNKARLRAAASGGFINATDCADFLTKKGVPFRTAYKITGELVAHCIEHDTTLEALDLGVYKAKSDVFDAGVYEAVNLDNCVRRRTSYGGTAPDSVLRQVEQARVKLREQLNVLP